MERAGGFIVRQNGQVHHTLKDDWQYGALFITTYRKNELLSLKFGIYYNKEFFGNYFIPLAGIDWQISAKDNLFGVLPGNLIFDHNVNVQFHYGISFRALTNSYRLETPDACALGDCSGKNYLRIDDNQLGLFSDFYLSRKIVFTGEIGHTILRRYRFGFKGDKINSKNDERTDNFYARVSLAYRLPLR